MSTNREEIQEVQAGFKSAWKVILDEVLSDPNLSDIRHTVNWMETVLEENVPQGKHTRGLLSVYLYRKLKPNRTEEEDFLNYVTGWVIELVHRSMGMLTDIMSNSSTRDGKPCWHRKADVGLSAINDAFLLETVAYIIAFRYLDGKNYLTQLMHVFRNNGFKTYFGESMNLSLTQDGAPNLSRLNESTYKALVKYKTSYFTFFGPVASALLRTGVNDQESLTAVEGLTLKIGQLFQIQEDFLGCYGDPQLTGRIGLEDIEDGKLTWLIVKALELATGAQAETLQKHYGQPIITAAEKVKRIYDDLDMEALFYRHENAARLDILADIQALPDAVPKELFIDMLDAIYRRKQ